MVIEDVEGSDEEADDSLKENNLIETSKGNNSERTAKTKISEGKKMVNGDVRPSELFEKNKKAPSLNGNGGGDTKKSKDIWDSEEIETAGQQSPVSTNQKGDALRQDTQVRTEVNNKENTTADIKDGAKTNFVNKTEDFNKADVRKQSASPIEEKSDLTEEKQTRDNEEESDKETAENKSDMKSEDCLDSEEQKTETNPLTRPVFYQRPFPDSCLKLREEGNSLFKNGQYGEAFTLYTKIINILENGKVHLC